MSTPNPFQPPKAPVVDALSGEAPPLWNPNAAANWSLLFSPIFGSLLQMMNWQALGEPDKAAKSKVWAIVSACFFALLILISLFARDSRAIDGFGRIGGLILLLAWYFSAGKSQSKWVFDKYGRAYPRKGWAKPLLLAVVAMIAIIFISGFVGVVAGRLRGA